MPRRDRRVRAPLITLGITALAAAVLVAGVALKWFQHTQSHRPLPTGPTTPGAPAAPVKVVPFSRSSPWSTPIPANARPAADSGAVVANLLGQIRANHGRVALNATQYSATLYTVGAKQPRVNISYDDCQGRGTVDPGFAKALAAVPVPSGAVGSAGSDSEISIFQPSSNTLWEFWKFSPQPGGGYSACWGGKIENVSRNPGVFTYPYGATASGLPLAGFEIRTRELMAGEIDHALGLNIVAARRDVTSWPATRTDGNGAGDDATDPVEGQRFRLDPKLNLSRYQLNPLALMVARAAQRYGVIVTDQSTGAVTIQAQDPRTYMAGHRGRNPYTRVAGSLPLYALLQGIPWSHLQAMPLNYGKGTG